MRLIVCKAQKCGFFLSNVIFFHCLGWWWWWWRKERKKVAQERSSKLMEYNKLAWISPSLQLGIFTSERQKFHVSITVVVNNFFKARRLSLVIPIVISMRQHSSHFMAITTVCVPYTKLFSACHISLKISLEI